jgi:PAS domain S-box-containing protein
LLDWIDFGLASLTLLGVSLRGPRRREDTAWILALAILGAAFLDLLYVLEGQRFYPGTGGPEVLRSFSASCRMGAATSLTLGAGLLLVHRRRPTALLSLVSMEGGALLLLAVTTIAVTPALLARLSGLWVRFPLDAFPLAAWVVAGGLLQWVIGRGATDAFSHSVVLSALPQAGSHLYLTLGQSGRLAELLQLLAYLMPAAAVTLFRSRPVPAATSEAKRREQRTVEERLRSKEIQLRQLTENIREIFWMTSPDQSEVHYVSPAYESTFGRTCESLYRDPRSFLDAIHPEDRARIEEALPRRAQGEFEYEYRVVRPDGSIRWIWSRAFPVRDDTGKVYRIAGISEDITERKLAADEREAIRLISELLLTSPPLESIYRDVPRLVSERFGFPLVAVAIHDAPTREMVYRGWAGAQFSEPVRVPIEAAIAGKVIQTGKAFLAKDVASSGVELHPILRQLPGKFVCCLPMKLGERVLGALCLSAEQERRLEPETMENLQLIANDIAQAVERKQAEEALRRSEARNRALVEALPDLIFRLDRRGVFLDYNAPQEVLARPPAEFLGRHVGEVLPPTLAGEAQAALERALSSGKMQNFEYRLNNALGLRDFEARFVPLGEEEVLVIVRDITERKRLEREILEVSGREQRRIGQDLHDGLCQQLSGIALISRALEKSLAEKSLPESETAARITALVLHSVDQTRSLARGLYPVELERSGIVAALRDLAEQTQGLFAIASRFHCDAPVEIHDRVTALHLYRIAQEAVGNAARHARARQIVVTLAQDQDTLRLTVSDDGRGMPRELERGQGMGLSIMNYRARIIDATLDIQPRAEGGTVVTCTLRNPNP